MVYDGDGDYMAPALAQKLAGEGFEVEIVTPHSVVSPFAEERSDGPFLREQLHEAGITAQLETELVEIAATGVTLADPFGDRREQQADAVVLVTQRLSDDSLYHEAVSDRERLRGADIQAVYRIGDCLAPRDVGDVIYDAHRLAREIEGEDPSVPLPPRREHLGPFVERIEPFSGDAARNALSVNP
jgi:dimethylamine/trimethylamine dehydrogenase